jgi:hypothetical protein
MTAISNKGEQKKELRRKGLSIKLIRQMENQANYNLHPDQDVVVTELSQWILQLIKELSRFRKV